MGWTKGILVSSLPPTHHPWQSPIPSVQGFTKAPMCTESLKTHIQVISLAVQQPATCSKAERKPGNPIGGGWCFFQVCHFSRSNFIPLLDAGCHWFPTQCLATVDHFWGQIKRYFGQLGNIILIGQRWPKLVKTSQSWSKKCPLPKNENGRKWSGNCRLQLKDIKKNIP